MAEIVVNDQASSIMADMISAIANATIGGANVFAGASLINDAESFIRINDVLKVADKPEVGIVEGTMDEQAGSDSSESSVVKLPFEMVVRFLDKRNPGVAETTAMQRGKYYIEAAKAAIMQDRSRGGRTNLVTINGEAINGTTVYGIARPLLKPSAPNEAFYAFAIGGAVAWSVLT